MKKKILCNPLNIDYKFQHIKSGHAAFREAADPTLILFKGRYYLFPSMSAGFWHSDDLINWEFHENRNLPVCDYAPDVRQIGDHMYFTASRIHEPSTFYRTKDPFQERYEAVSSPFPFWDPHMFQDDDGRVYFYWGCSNKDPIRGAEMDPETMLPISEPVDLVGGRPDIHGFERIFNNGKLTDNPPFIEGAYVNKYKGKYYLQYSCPGTEYNTYCDGVYVSDKPLGPYMPQESNPFTSKPGGYICGSGHGSTFRDKYGNWWYTGTMTVSMHHLFERRIGLFPAGFDAEGIMFCNQNFADYPLEIPEGSFDPWSIEPRWMLLSYKKPARCSSYVGGHPASHAVDENVRTWWCAAGKENGEFLAVDLEKVQDVYAIQVNFAEEGVPARSYPDDQYIYRKAIDTGPGYTRYLLEGSADGEKWEVLADKREAETDLSHDLIVLDEKKSIRFVKITGFGMPLNQRMAISGLRVFGIGQGERPAKTEGVQAVFVGDMDMLVQWEKVPGAIGYNLRYGHAPDKMYHSWLVYEQNELMLTTIVAGKDYYVCVDSFNEAGVTKGNIIRVITTG